MRPRSRNKEVQYYTAQALQQLVLGVVTPPFFSCATLNDTFFSFSSLSGPQGDQQGGGVPGLGPLHVCAARAHAAHGRALQGREIEREGDRRKQKMELRRMKDTRHSWLNHNKMVHMRKDNSQQTDWQWKYSLWSRSKNTILVYVHESMIFHDCFLYMYVRIWKI